MLYGILWNVYTSVKILLQPWVVVFPVVLYSEGFVEIWSKIEFKIDT